MIRLENIEKYYQTKAGALPALCDINLDVKSGEIFGVIGKSGAGKSTLLRCVNLLEKPDKGRVYLDNCELTALTTKQLRNERKHIGMIFQNYNLLSSRTVFQNIAFSLELAKYHKQKIKNRVDELLNLVGLEDKAHVYPNQLSGGQKQRVAIARALANEPKVLLSDEATSALDPQTTKSILQLLKEINQKFGLTILLITHEMDVIKQICDQVAVLDHGKIVETAKVANLFAKPTSEISKEILQSHQELPDELRQRISAEKDLHAYPILRIIFHNDAAKKPLISQLIKQLNLEINILQANIEYIKNDLMGVMLVEAIGEDSDIQKAIASLRKDNISVEIVGYVNLDA